ncbi:hypothetical protein D3C72_2597450 [compost metagenome]
MFSTTAGSTPISTKRRNSSRSLQVFRLRSKYCAKTVKAMVMSGVQTRGPRWVFST